MGSGGCNGGAGAADAPPPQAQQRSDGNDPSTHLYKLHSLGVDRKVGLSQRASEAKLAAYPPPVRYISQKWGGGFEYSSQHADSSNRSIVPTLPTSSRSTRRREKKTPLDGQNE